MTGYDNSEEGGITADPYVARGQQTQCCGAGGTELHTKSYSLHLLYTLSRI